MPRYRDGTPTIEARILAALRVAGGPLTVAQLHGPGRPGLTGRRSAEIRAACEELTSRGDLVECLASHMSFTYGLAVREEVSP
jgi:hypothetical protein